MASKHEIVAKIVAKAESDEAFRKQLKADPIGTVKGMGYTTRPGVAVKVLEETADEAYLVLPFTSKPGKGGELSDDALGAATGGTAMGCPFCGQG